MQDADILMLTTVIGNLVGWLLKNKTGFQNRMIPYVMIGISMLKTFLTSAGLLPAGATVLSAAGLTELVPFGSYAMAGFQMVLWFIFGILFDAALPIGMHSMFKNLAQKAKVAKKKK